MQRWTADVVTWRSLNETRREFEGCNAFVDPMVPKKSAIGYTWREGRFRLRIIYLTEKWPSTTFSEKSRIGVGNGT